MCVNFLYYQIKILSNLLLCGRTDLLSNLKSYLYLPQELNTIYQSCFLALLCVRCFELGNFLRRTTTQNGASGVVLCVIVDAVHRR